MSNNTQFKQILIDLDNYNSLKNLGKAGDSFNDVLRVLLANNDCDNHTLSDESITENIIKMNADNKSFILKIDSGLRKVRIGRILGFKDHLRIDFLDDDCLNLEYPSDLLQIPKEVESALLNSNLQLPNHAVKRIVNYFEEHVHKIETGIIQLQVK